ncbi:MAG: hybrid sensor histidine kinase/response regulator [Candidatus Omnitrophica bacterium]|nr:hybrid sensor histidine kinase/response regulator [Candidatus Omnitrophota bacterium]
MNFAKSKVLIVDDTYVNRSILRELLTISHPEYDIVCAVGGREALQMVQDIPPDIILLDVMMPDLDGFEVCKILKSDDRYKNIPIIIITALDNIDQKINGFKLGADDYIPKPINEDEIKARVEAHLRIKKYQDDLKDANRKLKRAHNALLENAKMSAVGSFAAGISHEFNNILTMMGGYTQLSLKSRDVDELLENNKVVDELVVRGKEIIEGLLSFAWEDEYHKKCKANIIDLVERDLLLLKKFINDGNIKIVKEYEEIPDVFCWASQMSQVFINIIKNSIDSMSSAPEKILTIRIYPADVEFYMQGKDKNFIVKKKCVGIDLSDTGCGIPEKVKKKIFEPFVTTKGVFGGGDNTTPGTGLGLSIVYGIVKRHKGIIVFNSKEGEGTMFKIKIPVKLN